MLSIWNVVPDINFVVGAAAGEFAGTGAVFNTWDIVKFLDHGK